jgi:hypothetical protein
MVIKWVIKLVGFVSVLEALKKENDRYTMKVKMSPWHPLKGFLSPIFIICAENKG